MNRIKFLSKITYTAGILLAMALTLSCSDDKDDPPPAGNPNPITPYACIRDGYGANIKLCTCFLNPSASEAEKGKKSCLNDGGTVMNKCPSNSSCYIGGQQNCLSSCY